MATISDYLNYSEISFAAYAENLTVGARKNSNNYQSALMTESQAQLFDNTWEVIKQTDDYLYSNSGFSVTLFKNTQTGEYVFANR